MLSPHRLAFVEAAGIALDLAASPEVESRWDAESACAGMTVGGLAQHLVSQASLAVNLLEAEPGGAEPITMLEHYERAAWANTDLDSEANAGIRTSSDERAAVGADAVLRAGREALARVSELLALRRDPDRVHLSWQGWSLTTDDFLTTRMMEIVVHSDDLAASVDLPTPDFPDAAITPVLGLLTAVAVRRHGQAALVRALSRPQRAPDIVSAF